MKSLLKIILSFKLPLVMIIYINVRVFNVVLFI